MVNFCTIDKREYIDRDSGTLSYGVIELVNADKASRGDIKNIREGGVAMLLMDMSIISDKQLLKIN